MVRTSLPLFAALAGVMFGANAVAAPFPSQTQVAGGALAGAVEGDVLSFKGIPFAAPPVGALRWRAPQPATPWRGVFKATTYGHDCMQKPFPSDAAPLGTEPAEDCLVMNVWRPAAQTAAKLPVMVWIYGGGFVNGGSSPAVYDGSQFAKHGIVFVSFNYRLGRFGFFAHPALSKAAPAGEPLGNYAYMDQIAALKWVQKNIASFGGDRNNVTVFGESAGGGSVHMLLTAPAARGLFHKAIIESGGGRGPLVPMRHIRKDLPGMPSGESVGVAFAKSAGITGDGPDALSALRALPAERLVDGLNMASMGAAAATYVGGPLQDDVIVGDTPEKVYAAARQARTPIMIGANSQDLGRSSAKTIDEAMAGFPDAAKARAAYDPTNSGDTRAVLSRVGMDSVMVEPARLTAQAFASQGLAAYQFRFSYVAQSLRARLSGATHASEIPFVFDTVAAKYGKDLKPEDAATAKAANAYWANFAKTGNPNGPGLPTWPAYDPRADVILDFTNDGPRAGADPWRARLDLTAAAAGQ